MCWNYFRLDKTLPPGKRTGARSRELLGILRMVLTTLPTRPWSSASVRSLFRLVVGAGPGGLIGFAYNGTPRALAISLVAVGLMTLALVLYSERGKLFYNSGDAQSHG